MSAIILPATMDRTTLLPLAREMMDVCAKGEGLVIDGSKVSRVGLVGLQLLVGGLLAAKEKGVSFEIADPSDELIGAATLSGLSARFGMAAAGAPA